MTIFQLPKALTIFRMVVGLSFIPLALAHAPGWLLAILLACGFVSDILDGVIARRVGVATLSLRRLDTRTDLLFYTAAVFATLIANFISISDILPWVAGYIPIFLLRNIVDYVRYHASPSYHMWSGKLWSIVVFVYLLTSLLGSNIKCLLPLAFFLYAINAVEGIAASLVLPVPCKDISSLWHVFKYKVAK